MGTLEVTLFGKLRLKRNGQTLGKLPSRRVRDLLAFLLINRKSMHNRAYLAGLFWPDLDEKRARHCLNTALWRLQKVLSEGESGKSDYLLVDSQTIAFNQRSDVRADLFEFDRCCRWAEQTNLESEDQQVMLYRRSVELHRDRLLTDCYEDWCLIERERTSNLYLRSLTKLLTRHFEREEFDEAAQYARDILAIDPLREEVHRDLIDILIADGRPAEALRQYRDCEAILDRDLGVQPMNETQQRLRYLLARSSAEDHRSSGPRSREWTESLPEIGAELSDPLTVLRDRAKEFDRAYDRLKAALEDVEARVEQIQKGVSRDLGPRSAYDSSRDPRIPLNGASPRSLARSRQSDVNR
jgi:DNA-binding SARP family transcriptional activator